MLVVEVPVDRTLRAAGQLGDVASGSRLQPALVDNPAGGVQYGLAEIPSRLA